MQLFPFLAVLICTVGALVTLLVAYSREAEVLANARAKADARAAEEAEEAKLESQSSMAHQPTAKVA